MHSLWNTWLQHSCAIGVVSSNLSRQIGHVDCWKELFFSSVLNGIVIQTWSKGFGGASTLFIGRVMDRQEQNTQIARVIMITVIMISSLLSGI